MRRRAGGGLKQTMAAQPIELSVDLRQVLSWRPAALRFDALEEARFWYVSGPERVRHCVVSGVIALITYNLFLLTDLLMIPDVFEKAVWVRLFGLTPLGLGILFTGGFCKDVVLRKPYWVLEGVTMITGVLGALSLAWLLLQSSSPCASLYTCGLMPIVIYGNLVQRFRFRFALIFSVAMVLIGVLCAMAKASEPHPYAVYDVPLVMLIMLIALYTLVMNYRFELEERRHFQWRERAKALHDELAASQVKLEDLSRRDPLTGVPNRRHVDEYVQLQWSGLQSSGGLLALLLIDVDHFKAYNDRYGHPAGDQCLRHVAQALQQDAAASVGCVARWGGEEFMVALPDVTVDEAMACAQRMCDAVNGLGLRHEASTTAHNVTISVGVAMVRPGLASASVDGAVGLADAALYRAKREGRNRCVLSLT